MPRVRTGKDDLLEEGQGRDLPPWATKAIIVALFGLVLSLVAFEWQGIANGVGQNRQDIDQLQQAITKMETYQEADKMEQKVQTQILQKMLEAVEKRNSPAGTATGEGSRP